MITPPDKQGFAHERRVASYRNEVDFYLYEAHKYGVKMPRVYFADYTQILMSDESLPHNENYALALEWLAKFHQVGFGTVTKLGTGGYWALAKRPDELQRLSC